MLKRILKRIITPRVMTALNSWKETIDWITLNSLLSYFPSQTLRKIFLRIKGARIAPGVLIYSGCEYRFPKGLVISEGTSIGHRSTLDARKGLIIGENVVFGTEVMVWTLHHDYNDINFSTIGGSVTIGNYAWLGSRCIILPGVTVGIGAIVASGAVVTKDVEPYTVVGGVPAKLISQRRVQNYGSLSL